MAKRRAIIVIADEKQFPPAVFLVSRLASLNPRGDIDVVLASNSPRRLAEAKELGGKFLLLDIGDPHSELNLPAPDYFTRATYYPLFVPRLLASQYDRVVYVDVDTYPESEKIFDLFDLELGRYAIGAVRDLNIPFVPNPGNGSELAETLKLPQSQFLGAKYLNSGVLVIDVDAFQQDRIEKRALMLIRERRTPMRYPDQTLFNAILRTRWLELSPSFNMITRARASFIRRFSPPSILHFTGSVKPWHHAFAHEHGVVGELRAFLGTSPWPAFINEANPPLKLSVTNFKRPWRPTIPPPQWQGEPLVALVRYLRETPFADVDQGLTALDPSALSELAA